MDEAERRGDETECRDMKEAAQGKSSATITSGGKLMQKATIGFICAFVGCDRRPESSDLKSP